MSGSPTRTTRDERILDWEGCLNARDVGGLAVPGGRIRRGALARSDVLNGLTPSGVAALVAHGIRTVVDVRAADEIAVDWEHYPLRDHGLVRYLNVPFARGRDEHMVDQVRSSYNTAQSRAALNQLDLDSHRIGIGAIVATIADALPGGVLVHCHAGKDRTGMIIALILAAVGAATDDVADDYALTGIVLEPLIAAWLDEMSDDETERARLRRLAEPTREAMLDTLAYVRARYGSAAEYLVAAGVSLAQLGRLQERLVAPLDVG